MINEGINCEVLGPAQILHEKYKFNNQFQMHGHIEYFKLHLSPSG